MFKNPTIDFNALFNPLGNSTCSSPEVVLALLFYDGNTIHNASDQFVSCVYFFFVGFVFIHPHRQKSNLYAPTSNSCIFTPIENWTHVFMNLLTRNSPYYHLLKYLLFLQKHPVYWARERPFLPLPGMDPRFLSRPARSYNTDLRHNESSCNRNKTKVKSVALIVVLMTTMILVMIMKFNLMYTTHQTTLRTHISLRQSNIALKSFIHSFISIQP